MKWYYYPPVIIVVFVAIYYLALLPCELNGERALNNSKCLENCNKLSEEHFDIYEGCVHGCNDEYSCISGIAHNQWQLNWYYFGKLIEGHTQKEKQIYLEMQVYAKRPYNYDYGK